MRFRLPIAVALALLLVASCDGPGDTTANIVPRSNEVGPDGGSLFVAVTAVADWTISLEFPEGTPSWATADPASGTGSRADVRLRYDANDGDDARSVTMVLKPGKGKAASVVVYQLGRSSGIPGYGGYGKDVTTSRWLEIPATVEGDGRSFFAHDMAGGAYASAQESGVRNWSFYWDFAEHMALWVAYPLNNGLKGSGGRSNEWGLDPLLPADMQPNLVGGSYGGGWTRGHQIPSADRVGNRQANISTFYGTNMTPQDYNFNSYIWAGLEAKVRDYASKSDTLYVVTGALFDDSTNYSGSSSGFAVKIPKYYFKALLYRGPSTYAANGFMAAGFLLPHDTSIAGGDSVDYIMSIDELEGWTGIDFFPNLSLVIGKEAADAIEAAAPSRFWK